MQIKKGEMGEEIMDFPTWKYSSGWNENNVLKDASRRRRKIPDAE